MSVIMQQSGTISRSAKFLKDIGIYAIGNLGSKIITFLMLPLYTHFVAPADYGYYNICLTVVLLLLPFTTLQLRDGTFRFLLDSTSTEQREKVVTAAYKTLLLNLLMWGGVGVIVSLATNIAYFWYTVAFLVAFSLQEVVSQVIRGLGDNKAFVAVGILASLGIGIFSVIFVVWMNMGIKGIFLANIIARLLCLVVVELKVKSFVRFFKPYLKVGQVAKDLLRFSLPLLPGALCSWLTTSSDQWIIKLYLGDEMTGIYATAVRFTSILQIVAYIFYQAWQETAILQFNSKDRDIFFSKMLNTYICFLCLLGVTYNFMLKLNYGWLVGIDFQSSWLYLYPLGISTLLYAISAFLEMGYQCAKDTKRLLPAIILCAIINVALNLITIKFLPDGIKVYGAVSTAIVTYLVLAIYRWIDVRRYLKLKIKSSTFIPMATLVFASVPYYLNQHLWQDAVTLVVAVAIILWFTPRELFMKIKGKFKVAKG